jgi:hypothetical protein
MINENNYDMWIGLLFCYGPIIIFLINAYRSSKSGSLVKKSLGYRGGYEWVKSDINVPFIKTGWFGFAMVWLVLGSVFFWGFLYPEHSDVWFTPVK